VSDPENTTAKKPKNEKRRTITAKLRSSTRNATKQAHNEATMQLQQLLEKIQVFLVLFYQRGFVQSKSSVSF
jgi:hypothetical protein